MDKGRMGKGTVVAGWGADGVVMGQGGSVERLAILTSCVDVLCLCAVRIRVFVYGVRHGVCDGRRQDDGVL
jgi:hypothetical protein